MPKFKERGVTQDQAEYQALLAEFTQETMRDVRVRLLLGIEARNRRRQPYTSSRREVVRKLHP